MAYSYSAVQTVQKISRALKDGALVERGWTKVLPYLRAPYRFLTWPLRRRMSAHSDNFYRAILDPKNPYSAYWASRYLGHLELKSSHGKTALDFACGKGRNIAHLRAAGFRVSGIDVRPDEYWKNFPDARFDITEPGSADLRYADGSFDLIVVSMVLGFFDKVALEKLFSEFERVLKRDGSIVLIESNIQSHAQRIMRAYFDRSPETVETITEIASKHFRIVDQWFEGYYAKFFPMTRNLIYGARQRSIGNWMVVDPRADQAGGGVYNLGAQASFLHQDFAQACQPSGSASRYRAL